MPRPSSLTQQQHYQKRKSLERAETAARVMAEPASPPAPAPALPLPPPTSALPGTREEVLVIEERRKMGYQLWNPQDAVDNVEGMLAFLSALTNNGGNRTHRSDLE